MIRIRLATGSAALALAVSLAAPAYAGEVIGTVADASDTAGLGAAEVVIEDLGRRTVTGRDGTYVFNDVPEGTYTITARYVGAEAVRFTINVPAEGLVRQNFVLGDTGSDILVLGQSANLASALSRKRTADGVSDVLTRDSIGQFPDQNVAESLRRLPGINVLNDQGEGRFVTVRGLDPNLNATSLNGVRVPAPGIDERGVALDVISSEIIESIEVKKSLTPDMDGDTIGASIEIKTTSAFDRKNDLYVVKLGGSYNDYSGQLTPDVGFDFANRLSDNFGVTGGLSYYKREFESDNVEGADWQEDGGLVYAEEIQYRDYDVERERISATLGFDARVGEHTELYLKGVYSEFSDQEFRRDVIFILEDANVSGSGTNAVFDDTDAEIEIRRRVKDRLEISRIRTVVFGGESRFGAFKADYAVSWAKSSETKDGSVDPTRFDANFEDSGLEIGFDYSNPRIPLYSVTGNSAGFLDPLNYGLDEVEFTAASLGEDEEFAVRLDLGYEIYSDAGTLTIQGGAKARWREKGFAGRVEFYENDNYTLADALGAGQTYRLTDISPLPGFTEATDFFNANRSDFELNAIDSTIASNNETYTVEEDIFASYLLGRWESDQLLVIGGVRYERTDNRMRGNVVRLIDEGQDLPGGGVAADDTVIVTQREIDRSYDHWLPSLNIRYAAQPNLIMRLAGYRSLVRPNIAQLAPRFEINEDNEAAIGNPDLVPYEAWNFDATVEYYMSSNGALTAGLFYKEIDNFIVGVVVEEPGSFQGIDFEEAETNINGSTAEIFGIELGFSQQLDFLPGALSGFLVQANYTFTDAKGLIPDSDLGAVTDTPTFREITLPSASKHTFNGVLGYEKGPLSLRLAGTYRDGYLDETDSSADEDRIVDSLFQLDFTGRYSVSKNLQVYFEWININDAEYFAFNRQGGRQNVLQFEKYNWTMKGGLRLTF
ncbi:TonB-dependent receptor [Erythrobacter sp.]|uniref:TonB-dependent receptor n=1 Tax=Erythrobacter sp. TaxID=1042 RepID=UPI0025F3E76E|nr:TonB-dependent receptor [Erythrobacter sp.]